MPGSWTKFLSPLNCWKNTWHSFGLDHLVLSQSAGYAIDSTGQRLCPVSNLDMAILLQGNLPAYKSPDCVAWQHLLYKHSCNPRGPGQAGSVAMRVADTYPCAEMAEQQAPDAFRSTSLWRSPQWVQWCCPWWLTWWCMLLTTKEREMHSTEPAVKSCSSSSTCRYCRWLLMASVLGNPKESHLANFYPHLMESQGVAWK